MTFSPPTPVNDTGVGHDGTSQYLPKIAVSPGGRLDVIYDDRRADPENVMNEVPPVFVRPGPQLRLPDLGSRLGLLSSDGRALAMWTDTRAGTEASNKQDLARAVVSFSKASPLRPPLQLGGAVMAALGLVIVAWWAASRR